MKRRFSGICRSTASSTFFWLANFSTSPSESLGASSTARATTFVPSRISSERSSLLPFNANWMRPFTSRWLIFCSEFSRLGSAFGFFWGGGTLLAAGVGGVGGGGRDVRRVQNWKIIRPQQLNNAANCLEWFFSFRLNVVHMIVDVSGNGLIVGTVCVNVGTRRLRFGRGLRLPDYRLVLRLARGRVGVRQQLPQFFGLLLFQVGTGTKSVNTNRQRATPSGLYT